MSKFLRIVTALLSVVALVASLASLKVTFDLKDEVESLSASQTVSDDSKSNDTDADDSSDGDSDDEVETTTSDTEGNSGNWHIKILDSVETGTDYEGNTVVMVSAEATNIGDDASSPGLIQFDAYQDGVGLSTGFVSPDSSLYDSFDENMDMQGRSVQPDTTVTISDFFVLDSEDSPIELQIHAVDTDSNGTDNIVTAELDL